MRTINTTADADGNVEVPGPGRAIRFNSDHNFLAGTGASVATDRNPNSGARAVLRPDLTVPFTWDRNLILGGFTAGDLVIVMVAESEFEAVALK